MVLPQMPNNKKSLKKEKNSQNRLIGTDTGHQNLILKVAFQNASQMRSGFETHKNMNGILNILLMKRTDLTLPYLHLIKS